jgi:hypothetical protein
LKFFSSTYNVVFNSCHITLLYSTFYLLSPISFILLSVFTSITTSEFPGHLLTVALETLHVVPFGTRKQPKKYQISVDSTASRDASQGPVWLPADHCQNEWDPGYATCTCQRPVATDTDH